MKIILASGSPRRKELLSTIINNFDIMPSNISENKIQEKYTSPDDIAYFLSSEKAFHTFYELYEKDNKEFTIVAADTLVYFEGKILGKPKDKVDAINTLHQLQNNMNEVYTGVTILFKKENSIIIETKVIRSTVYFKPMSHQDIVWYVNTNEPMDKAGSYAIQGLGKKFILEHDGDYNSIVGLDTKFVRNTFKKYGIFTKSTNV